MDGQPGQEDGEGAGPDRDPGPPSPGAGGGPTRPGRAATRGWPGSRATAREGAPAPSGRLALLADELSGPGRRCPGADDDELAGLLQAWAAIESWAAGAKLGVIREMMRRDGPPSPGSDHGDLPETWSASLRYELAGALACSTQSAESAAWLAWELQARLPGIGARLEDGTLTQAKARAVTETFGQLMDADAATAEALIIGSARGQDLHPGAAAGRAGRPHRRPRPGRAAGGSRRRAKAPGSLLPRAGRDRRPLRPRPAPR